MLFLNSAHSPSRGMLEIIYVPSEDTVGVIGLSGIVNDVLLHMIYIHIYIHIYIYIYTGIRYRRRSTVHLGSEMCACVEKKVRSFLVLALKWTASEIHCNAVYKRQMMLKSDRRTHHRPEYVAREKLRLSHASLNGNWCNKLALAKI